jgi:competence protein ComGC
MTTPPDTIRFTCSACGYRARIPSSYSGKVILCPGCQAVQIASPSGGEATGNTVRVSRVQTAPDPTAGRVSVPDANGKIPFTCTKCGFYAKLAITYAGKAISCPGCKDPQIIPPVAPSIPSESSSTPAPTTASKVELELDLGNDKKAPMPNDPKLEPTKPAAEAKPAAPAAEAKPAASPAANDTKVAESTQKKSTRSLRKMPTPEEVEADAQEMQQLAKSLKKAPPKPVRPPPPEPEEPAADEKPEPKAPSKVDRFKAWFRTTKIYHIYFSRLHEPKFFTISLACLVVLILEILMLVWWGGAVNKRNELTQKNTELKSALAEKSKQKDDVDLERAKQSDARLKAETACETALVKLQETQKERDEAVTKCKDAEAERDKNYQLRKDAEADLDKEQGLRQKAAKQLEDESFRRRDLQVKLDQETSLRKQFQSQVEESEKDKKRK